MDATTVTALAIRLGEKASLMTLAQPFSTDQRDFWMKLTSRMVLSERSESKGF